VVKQTVTRILGALALLLFCLASSSSVERAASVLAGDQAAPQDAAGQKAKYDYISTFLSRNTKPLGLKEDLMMKKLLKQPRAIWAIRAGLRHILD
jgi:hypothetical protein